MRSLWLVFLLVSAHLAVVQLHAFDLLDRLQMDLHMIGGVGERGFLGEKARSVTLSKNRHSRVLAA
jgi:hypothetical protein